MKINIHKLLRKINNTVPQINRLFRREKNIMASRVIRNCNLVNVFHCCTYKSGSQWLRAIFSDEIVYAYSGLEQYTYSDELPGKTDNRIITERYFNQPFPQNKMISPIYITYDSFIQIPKTGRFKTIFVLRDPRDIVVSYYFSMKFSHSPFPQVVAFRKNLLSRNADEGILLCVQRLIDNGTFASQESWVGKNDPAVLTIRYEDLIGKESMTYFEMLFKHCQIKLPNKKLHALLDKYSFKNLSSGRIPGQENKNHHYRKGVAGDWRNYFSKRVENIFKQKTGDLLINLKYEKNTDW